MLYLHLPRFPYDFTIFDEIGALNIYLRLSVLNINFLLLLDHVIACNTMFDGLLIFYMRPCARRSVGRPVDISIPSHCATCVLIRTRTSAQRRAGRPLDIFHPAHIMIYVFIRFRSSAQRRPGCPVDIGVLLHCATHALIGTMARKRQSSGRLWTLHLTSGELCVSSLVCPVVHPITMYQ